MSQKQPDLPITTMWTPREYESLARMAGAARTSPRKLIEQIMREIIADEEQDRRGEAAA